MTKAELQQRVADLEAELAALKAAGPARPVRTRAEADARREALKGAEE